MMEITEKDIIECIHRNQDNLLINLDGSQRSKNLNIWIYNIVFYQSWMNRETIIQILSPASILPEMISLRFRQELKGVSLQHRLDEIYLSFCKDYNFDMLRLVFNDHNISFQSDWKRVAKSLKLQEILANYN